MSETPFSEPQTPSSSKHTSTTLQTTWGSCTLKTLLHAYHYACDAVCPTLADLCHFNAAVCEAHGLPSIACVWYVLSTLVAVKSIRQDEEDVHARSRSIISPTRCRVPWA